MVFWSAATAECRLCSVRLESGLLSSESECVGDKRGNGKDHRPLCRITL